ncbi:MAG: energy transducer TonB [Muribaculaceae bacterium]|nr:energy transducer TonB [Muribaculaceae bacterium]
MAKDVDLTSREWRDIVFEGKNKEYGAYEMRANSVARHTKAIVMVVIAVAIILVFLILSVSGVFSKPEEEQITTATVQELTTMEAEEEDIEEEEEQFQLPPEPEEIIAPEEVANQQQVTDLLIVEDDKIEEDKQVKNTEDVLENEAAVGAVDITEGTNDLNKVIVKEEVIAAPVVEDEPVSIAMVEQKPEFPGGEAAMYKWLGDNIVYPSAASEEGVQGRVVVEFVVGKDGSITNVRVVRPRHPALDKEALRVVKAMPKWVPGRNNGQPVKVTYTLPVTFKLQ